MRLKLLYVHQDIFKLTPKYRLCIRQIFELKNSAISRISFCFKNCFSVKLSISILEFIMYLLFTKCLSSIATNDAFFANFNRSGTQADPLFDHF